MKGDVCSQQNNQLIILVCEFNIGYSLFVLNYEEVLHGSLPGLLDRPLGPCFQDELFPLPANTACQNFGSSHARIAVLHHIIALHIRPSAVYFSMVMAVYACPITPMILQNMGEILKSCYSHVPL